ncbi:UNVERIFIED_CONTAM: hypothetical protein GTU68_066725 [Idotea baltica]|nr:hypothetical protein [Idotea baltica]
MSYQRLAEAVQKYYPNPNLDLLKKAYDYSEKQHRGQVRASGEPYFTHLVETALLACKLKLDMSSIIAALLHDSIEDCDVCRDDIEKEFGKEVANIVEGVTNLTKLEIESANERQAESYRKMFVAMAKDIRVILVKLCDRLHNMSTLNFLSETKQRKKAQETEDIYAPIANRLGIHWIKSELQDHALRYLRPAVYERIKAKFEQNDQIRSGYIDEVTEKIVSSLDAAGVSASVKGRAKHYYSIWKKMNSNNLTFDEVHDLLGFRIIVPTLRACYESLGIIHAEWKPVPNMFKDYIAMPKPNMYQSLHTTVIGPGGQRIEIQIRTQEMDRIAEQGVAAHWQYKEGEIPAAFNLQWVKELVENQEYIKNPDEFIQSVKSQLFPKEIFVFTPNGDLLRLPFEATPIDFAYSVHTDVGHATIGAKVNGSIVTLDHKLDNGDTVEIHTSKNQKPSKDWITYVKSSKAKQRIRSFINSEEKERSKTIGRELLKKDFRKLGLNLEVGYGKISSKKVATKLLPANIDIDKKLEKDISPVRKIFQKVARSSRKKIGVSVSGVDNIMVRFAKCCEPLPGDRIVGFITRGRGVTIHDSRCAQAISLDPLRKIDVSWDNEIKSNRKVKITVVSRDQRGLLAKVTNAITNAGADIKTANIKTTETQKAVIDFEISVEDSSQLQKVKAAIERVPGVIKVEKFTNLSKTVDASDID